MSKSRFALQSVEPRAFWRGFDRAELPLLKGVERVRSGGAVERATELLTIAGEHGAIWYVVGGMAALADAPNRGRWTRALGAVGLIYLASTLLKLVARRRRPPLAGHKTVTALSFPSSHAVTSFAAARLFATIEPRARLPLYAGATAITASRLHFCVHYPSDLLAGAALGDLAARATVRLCAQDQSPEV